MSYVEGTVADIVYRNEENGYTVLDLDCEGNLVICVGNIPLIQPGSMSVSTAAIPHIRPMASNLK